MIKKSFTSTEPIYVGFVGPAGAGKTFTARSIVPASTMFFDDPKKFPNIVWDHQWMSLPLYTVYNIRTQTEGQDKLNRIFYGIHDVVNSVIMKKIPFEDMIELIYDLYDLPITNLSDEKPRTFLQQAGDLFLKQDLMCLANYAKYKIYNMWRSTCVEYDRHDLDFPSYIGIISDIRQPHEAEMIKAQKNHLLIKLEASKDAIQQRLLDRDGILLSDSESSHRTEQSFDLIPNEWYDLVIDTSYLSKEDQVKIVKDFILSHNFDNEESLPLQ